MFDTTLATILFPNDLIKASELLNSTVKSTNVTAWTGLYKDHLTNNAWKMVDGADWTICPSTKTGSCIDDSMKMRQTEYPVAMAMMLTFEEGKPVLKDVPHNSVLPTAVLCNAPNKFGGYQLSTCDPSLPTNCWQYKENHYRKYRGRFSNIWIPVGMIPMWIDPSLSPFGIFVNQTNIIYSADGIVFEYQYSNYSSTAIALNRVIEYESTIYTYFSYIIENTVKSKLLHINLTTLQMQTVIIPLKSATYVDFCIVAAENNVYLLASTMFICSMYGDVCNKLSNILIDDIAACTINREEAFIYIFGKGQDVIYKYDIYLSSIVILDELNLCSINTGHGLRIPSGMAYLHGCYIGSWKTLLFNMDTETFDGVTHIA
eukprot:68061_1